MEGQRLIDNYNKSKRRYFIPLILMILALFLTPLTYLAIFFLIIFFLSLFIVNKLDSLKDELIKIINNIEKLDYSIPIRSLNKFKLKEGLKLFNRLNNHLYFYSIYLKILLLILNKNFKDAERELLFFLKSRKVYKFKKFIPSLNDTKVNNKKILYYLISESKTNKAKSLKNTISLLIQDGAYLNDYHLNKLKLSKKEKKLYLSQFSKNLSIKEKIQAKDIFRILRK